MRPRTRHFLAPLAAGLGVGASSAGIAFAMADYVVRRLTSPGSAGRPVHLGFTPFETGVDWEDVTFLADDGTALGGWLLVRDAHAPAILTCAGYRARRSDLLGIASNLWRAGFTVLLFDYRGYGDEPGHVTLGYHELADARRALRFLRSRRPHAPLGVIGYSMGAAVAIMLAAREPDVRAVLADSPFTSQREVVRYHMAREYGVLASAYIEPVASLILHLTDLRLWQRFGFRFRDVHPLTDVARLAPRPLFLIHGDADPIIPVDHTERLASTARDAGVPLETWFVPGAGHCAAYFADRATYCDRVGQFFATHLAQGTAVPATSGSGASPASQCHDEPARWTQVAR